MSPADHYSTAKLFPSFVIALVVVLLGQSTHAAQDSWLDRPLVNWNRPSGALPQLPPPSTPQGESANADRCGQQVRQPANAADRALVRKGWMLYGPVYSSDFTKIVTALSGFDGMCRPVGHQAFVYWEDRYAGTLSPVPMNSRADGSLTNIHLTTRRVSGRSSSATRTPTLSAAPRASAPSSIASGGTTLPQLRPRQLPML
jgi:hypothetical protein